MQYTEEQLYEVPISVLRGVDIMNADEERLVQKVLNARLKDRPAPNAMSFPASVTDNMTIEKERELQAIIDERNARYKANLGVALDEEEKEEEQDEVSEDDIPSTTPETQEESAGEESAPLADPTQPVETAG